MTRFWLTTHQLSNADLIRRLEWRMWFSFVCFVRTKSLDCTSDDNFPSCCCLYSPETLCESFFVPAGGLGGRGRWVSRETERWWLVNTVSNRAHNWSSRLTKPKPRPEALLHVTLYKAQPNRLVKHRAALWIETGWRGSAQIKQTNRESELNIHVRFIQKNKKKIITHRFN